MDEEKRSRYREITEISIREMGNENVKEVLTSIRDWVLSYDKL